MSTLSIDVFIISIKVCLNFILSVRKRTCVGKQQLFTHCKFKEEFIKLKQVP